MEESLKMLLESINNNINVLRTEYNLKIENIRKDIDLNNSDLKAQLSTLASKVDDIKENYVNKNDCKESRENLENVTEIKKEEISLKKLTILVGAISAGIASIVGLISKFMPS